MSSIKKNARIAGLLYLLLAITAPISLMYVPSALYVRGDVAATADNIRSSEVLFRAGIVYELTAQAVALFVAWALYPSLKAISPLQALLMVPLSVISTCTTFLNTLSQIAGLVILRGADFLSIFTKHQLDAFAYVFFWLQNNGMQAASIFWWLWLSLFGFLVLKSGFSPKTLGVLLIMNGFAYLAAGSIFFLLPQYGSILQRMLIPAAIVEPAVVLWLLTKSTRDVAVEPPTPIQELA